MGTRRAEGVGRGCGGREGSRRGMGEGREKGRSESGGKVTSSRVQIQGWW